MSEATISIPANAPLRAACHPETLCRRCDLIITDCRNNRKLRTNTIDGYLVTVECSRFIDIEAEMSEKHTKEPWRVGIGSPTIVYGHDGWPIANATVYHGRHEPETSAANARRIVACVNACAKLTDDELLRGLVVSHDLNSEVQERCDQLYFLLTEICEYWNGDPNEMAMRDALEHIIDISRAAIDAVGGGK